VGATARATERHDDGEGRRRRRRRRRKRRNTDVPCWTAYIGANMLDLIILLPSTVPLGRYWVDH
jgi:hypothetical protein